MRLEDEDKLEHDSAIVTRSLLQKKVESWRFHYPLYH